VLYVDWAVLRGRFGDWARSDLAADHDEEPRGRQALPNGDSRQELVAACAVRTAATTTNAKGKALEAVARALFALEPALRVKQVRRRLGDEEIDVVVLNDYPSAFWSSLRSPFLLVECKNWSSRVGAGEVRDFESKMRNHRAFVSLGFLVAANGFTSQARNALKRLSRDDVRLVLVGLSEIEDFALRDQRLTDWLEDLIAAFM
jgi:hypothetical protein